MQGTGWTSPAGSQTCIISAMHKMKSRTTFGLERFVVILYAKEIEGSLLGEIISGVQLQIISVLQPFL